MNSAKLSPDKKRHLVLTGFSGSGKTTVGRLLASYLGWAFCDTDDLIVRSKHMSIREIFERKGEAYFRRVEAQSVARAMAKSRRTVIALGGGALQKTRNQVLASANGNVVYLKCSVQELHRRLRKCDVRPLLMCRELTRDHSLAHITQLLNRRKRRYEHSDLTVSVTRKTVRMVSLEIIKRLGL